MPKMLLLTIDVGVLLESFQKRKAFVIFSKPTIFVILGNHDSLHFGIIPLTPSATKKIILGSPKDSPRFGQKRKITIHCHYSPVTIHPSLFTGTIHRYCSLRNFAYLRGAVPYIWGKCFLCLVQDFFLRESLPLRAFLCEISLLTLPTFSTKLVTSKAL